MWAKRKCNRTWQGLFLAFAGVCTKRWFHYVVLNHHIPIMHIPRNFAPVLPTQEPNLTSSVVAHPPSAQEGKRVLPKPSRLCLPWGSQVPPIFRQEKLSKIESSLRLQLHCTCVWHLPIHDGQGRCMSQYHYCVWLKTEGYTARSGIARSDASSIPDVLRTPTLVFVVADHSY